MAIEDERVNVLARFRTSGSVYRGTKQGTCQGFEIEVSIASPEPVEAIRRLIDVAHQMCFTEAALGGETPIEFRHLLNGEPIAGA